MDILVSDCLAYRGDVPTTGSSLERGKKLCMAVPIVMSICALTIVICYTTAKEVKKKINQTLLIYELENTK